jgi:hypothetical protein
LPQLVAEGCRVELALIDGNHSHPFPVLDFHYMDQMLSPDGLLLIDNTEIHAVEQLTAYLEFEAAYRLERLLGNCAVYRKVKARAFGWKAQTIGAPSGDVDALRRELTRLRMEVAPDLRASLSGANPLPGWPEAGKVPSDAGARRPFHRGDSVDVRATIARLKPSTRRVHAVARWYTSPSGALAGVGLFLLAVGIAVRGVWRLIGGAGVAALATFLPYRFIREQRRTDRQIDELRASVANGNRRIWALTRQVERFGERIEDSDPRTTAAPVHRT